MNTEITRMIMLRESTGQVRARKDDCDCGILGEVVDGLDGVLNQGKGDEAVVEEGEEKLPLFKGHYELHMERLRGTHYLYPKEKENTKPRTLYIATNSTLNVPLPTIYSPKNSLICPL